MITTRNTEARFAIIGYKIDIKGNGFFYLELHKSKVLYVHEHINTYVKGDCMCIGVGVWVSFPCKRK